MKGGIEQTKDSEIKRAPKHRTELTEKTVIGYIERGKKVIGKLACSECPHPELCAAAIEPLVSRNPKTIPEQEVELIESYSIKIENNGLLCHSKIVKSAIRRSANKEFWILTTDPLIESSIDIQSAEAIRQTISSLISLIMLLL